jgi:hypothetical protein
MTENGSTSSQAGTVTVAVGIVSVFSSSKTHSKFTYKPGAIIV